MTGYGQFCPVAKAMEVLDERWTMLVLRELMSGSTRYNEIRRGVPKMSPALLSKRLRSLERSGLVERQPDGAYALTPCGGELFDVVQGIGAWGLKWVPELGDEDYDPHLLMWDMKRTVPAHAWPPARTVVQMRLDDVDSRVRSWWFVVLEGQVDVCDADPGHEVTATLHTTLRVLVRIWRGERSWDGALASGEVDCVAPAWVRHAIPGWFGQSRLAATAGAAPVA